MRLAGALELGHDPAIEPKVAIRRAVEVYPHPALVALFGLEVTLKYKQKRGRSVASRQAAFSELFRHIESLRSGDPPLDLSGSSRWAQLRREVEGSISNAAMDRCEDEIDAYVCAYVALYYWTHGLTRCRVVGDLTSGYIVTPVTEQIARELDLAAVARLSYTSSSDDAQPSRPGATRRPPTARDTTHAEIPTRVVSGYCGCGCGSEVRARYLPGHDARHKSALVRAARAGDKQAESELVRPGWGRFIGAPKTAP